jgi:DNA repair exonuclease SbcCD ATPase subunit
MVVEEVSLVDRAANKHRFLVVKRDAPMKDTPETEQPNEDETPEKAPPKKKPVRGKAKKADTADAIATATGILERLTAAVGALGEASDDDAEELLIELASELSEAAAEIAEVAGVAEGDEEETETDKRAPVSEAIGKVRALLAEVTSMIATAKEAPAQEAAAPEPPAPAPSPESRVSEQLEAVATSLRTLTDAVKEQGQRLGRLEKNTALPNSRSHEERPRAHESADVGWPLDLNRPKDRESVDKALSFHDR